MARPMRFKVLCTMTVAWFLALSFLTFQPGKDTTIISGGIAEMAQDAMETPFESTRALELKIREFAHPVSFFILAALLIMTVGAAGAATSAYLAAFIALLAWSVLSEILKIPIPGRDFNWPDVKGNLIGSCAGAAGAWLWERKCLRGLRGKNGS